MTTADENNQHNESVDEDTPEDRPKPPSRPDRPAKQVNGPPSIKLKGEWKAAPSCDLYLLVAMSMRQQCQYGLW